MRLEIKLPTGWTDSSGEDPDRPASFVRNFSVAPGNLEVCWLEHEGEAIPGPDADDLQEMAEEFGEQDGFGELVSSSSSPCDFGTMGTAVFRSPEHARSQMWQLSNGKDYIMVTHTCAQEPEPDEVQEVQEIVRTLVLREDKPKWTSWLRT